MESCCQRNRAASTIRGGVISASGVATVLRDGRGDRRNRGARSAARARRRRQRQPIRAETPEAAAGTQLQCIIRSGARANGAGSCARPTGRATPTSSGRPGRRRTRRRSDREAGSARRARPCPRRNVFIEMRSAILVDPGGTAPRRRRDVIRTRDEPPRTMEEGEAPSRRPASKPPSSAIDPSPPRPRDGRSGTK